jgi:uncharacterized membrane protein (UPF0127 family)
MFRLLRSILAALAITLSTPMVMQPQALAEAAMMLPVHMAKLAVDTRSGVKLFSIEIADESSEQERGLMFRTDMPDDRGMLFPLNVTREASFWMENTPMPLDLLFIGDDGRVKAILKGQPFSRAPISPGVPVRFVLELKEGISARNGIEPGDRLRHPVIDAIVGSK